MVDTTKAVTVAAGVEPYRLAADTIGPEEIRAAKLALDSGQLTMASRVREFEREFAEWVGTTNAIMVNSGSSANLLMIDALLRTTSPRRPLVAGDEVIVPGLAWPTTVWPISQLGLVPVFADVDPATLVLDLESARSVLGPRTRAMFVIHPLGRAIDRSRFAEFCSEHDLVLLEDCCESLGAHSDARHAGTTGAAASFSFYFSHHISTVEGGMIITDDAAMADDLRGLRAHGWVRDRSDKRRWTDDHPELDERFLFATVGYNVRPTEIQAAIGSVQLRRLDEMLVARESLAADVNGWLQDRAPWLELIGSDAIVLGDLRRRDRSHSWMTLPMRLDANAPIDRDSVVAHLERCGVETRPVIAGNLARHPAVRQVPHRSADSLRHCDALLSNSFMIGCHPTLSRGSYSTLERAIASLADAEVAGPA